MTLPLTCAMVALLASVASAPAPAGPDGYTHEKLRGRAQFLLGRTEEALAQARALNRRAPDDLDTYALLVDIYRAQGRSADAEREAQWMLDLRPEDPRGLLRAALLRADAGDANGARQLLRECFVRTPPARWAERDYLRRLLAAWKGKE